MGTCRGNAERVVEAPFFTSLLWGGALRCVWSVRRAMIVVWIRSLHACEKTTDRGFPAFSSIYRSMISRHVPIFSITSSRTMHCLGLGVAVVNKTSNSSSEVQRETQLEDLSPLTPPTPLPLLSLPPRPRPRPLARPGCPLRSGPAATAWNPRTPTLLPLTSSSARARLPCTSRS